MEGCLPEADFLRIIGAEAFNYSLWEATPKQILINAHLNFQAALATDDLERTILEVEDLIKQAEPMADKIFLETARAQTGGSSSPLPATAG